jgi:hypothetical protein
MTVVKFYGYYVDKTSARGLMNHDRKREDIRQEIDDRKMKRRFPLSDMRISLS